MKKFSLQIIAFSIMTLLSTNSFAQKDYWKILFPGYDFGTYKASIDDDDNLNLALNGLTANDSNKFISINKHGFITFESSTTEIPLLHFKDNNNNRYLISWNSPNLHVQKFDTQNLLLWNTSLTVTNPLYLGNPTDKYLFINAAQYLLTSNNKLIVAGNFKVDTVTSNYAVTAFVFDANSGQCNNFFYHPQLYYQAEQIDLQEDSQTNINLVSYDEFLEEFDIDKFDQNGNYIKNLVYGDMWNFASIKEHVEVSKNCIYFGLSDSTGYHIIGLDKNLDSLFVYDPGYYLDFGDFFYSDDSSFFMSHDNATTAGDLRKFDYYGNLICTDNSSSYYNYSYKMFMANGNVYSVREAFGVADNNCNFTTCSAPYDSTDWWFVASYIGNDTRYGRDAYSGKHVSYLGCKNNLDVFGITAMTESTPNDFAGRIYFDVNNNCVPDSGEAGLAYQLVQISPNGSYFFTDKNGNFQNYLDSGSYNLTTILNDNTLGLCPASVSLQINDTSLLSANNNLGIQGSANSLMDLAVTLNQSATVPGHLCDMYVSVSNHGPINASGVVMLTIDTSIYSLLTFVNPAPD